jgi:3-hydroxybutyryl-CoA dehydratase
VTPGRTITEADVAAFSALTGDRHPQHTDAQWAARGPFGARVAHGMLILSYAVGLVPFDPERIVALRRIENVVFKRPVRIGDTIRVETRVVRPDDGRGLEAYEWRIVNQHGKLVARATVEAVVRRDQADAEGARAEDTLAPKDGDTRVLL